MDLRSVLTGLRTLRPDDLDRFAASKDSALRSAYAALGDEAFANFEAFVDAVPPSVLTTYFGSDGIDHHYTRLLSGLAAGEPIFDATLAATINYILLELIYQGRYLAKYEPEALIVAGGNSFLLGCALANASRIESFKIGSYVEPDAELTARMNRLALNARPLVWGTSEVLANSVTTALGRPLGCLAMLDIGLPDQANLPYAEIASPLLRHFTPDTFHLFAGETAAIANVRRQIEAAFPGIALIHRAYSLNVGSAMLQRSILVANGFTRVPELNFEPPVDRYTLERTGDYYTATGLTGIIVRPMEPVPLKLPEIVSSSAPLSAEQIRQFAQPLELTHWVAKIRHGRVIHAASIFAQTYAIATSTNQIFEHLHIPSLLGDTPYGKPDENGIVEVPAKPTAFVDGPVMLFSFSPAIVSYHSHFLLQCFPRITTAEEMGLPNTRMLVPNTIRGYQRRMLEMVGWGEDRLILMDPGLDYVCESLLVPNIPPAIFSPFQARVYDNLVNQIEHTPIDPKKRIIISRAARTTWRNMVNYDAVTDMLVENFGFEVVEPDKLSIEDEIRLFQSSAIVVGAEGAGLYNCCFMAKNSDVIVLADQDYVMYVVGSMAAIRGFDLSFVFGESFQAERDLTRRAGHADFVLDPMRVKMVVEQTIERQKQKFG